MTKPEQHMAICKEQNNIYIIEHMEFGYAHGYTEGMMRVLSAVENCSADLKHHQRRFTQKEIASMISVMIADREKLRENPFAFVRCNQEKGWEVYIPERYRNI